jgi:hypothetical protein
VRTAAAAAAAAATTATTHVDAPGSGGAPAGAARPARESYIGNRVSVAFGRGRQKHTIYDGTIKSVCRKRKRGKDGV